MTLLPDSACRSPAQASAAKDGASAAVAEEKARAQAEIERVSGDSDQLLSRILTGRAVLFCVVQLSQELSAAVSDAETRQHKSDAKLALANKVRLD